MARPLGLTVVGAVGLWVRTTLRRHWGATVAIAVLAGLSAGLVGAAFQAARRADGAIERHAERSRTQDVVLFGCPPGVDANPETTDLNAECGSREVADRLRREVVAGMPEVEGAVTVGTLVSGIVGIPSPNGWGRLVLIFAAGDASPPMPVLDRQILVAGRFPSPTAPDEVMIGEQAARIAGLHPGDTVRLASWSQDHLDAGIDGLVPPETPPIECRLVGIVRMTVDVQGTNAQRTDAGLPDAIYVGPGWTQAHAAAFARYGFGVAVRLHGGPGAIDSYTAALDAARGEWSVFPDDSSDVDESSIRRVIDAERQAVLVFALIATIAGLAFVGLTLVRQLRREVKDSSTLSALGLTRGQLMVGATARALVAGSIAAVIAVGTVLILSPFGPLGLARRLEYSTPIRVDAVVLVTVPLVVLVVFGGATVVAVASASRVARRDLRTGVTSGVPLGPVSRTAMSFVRGGSPRVAIAVGGVAIAAAVAAGTLLASFERVVSSPARYGASWDLAVGQYSDPAAFQDGVDRLRANPDVVAAAAIFEGGSDVALDGMIVPYIGPEPVIGRPQPVMASGQPPIGDDEVALGAMTSRMLHKDVGDTLALTWTAPPGAPGEEPVTHTQTVRVTGIAVLNNPITSATNAGEGVLVNVALTRRIVGIGTDELAARNAVPQSITVTLSPTVDRETAIESVRKEFSGSVRPAAPPADLRNLDRIRFVPWLIAGLVGLLALASLVHAMVTLLQRHGRDLAVLAALGMTRRQERRVGRGTGAVLVGGSVLIGVPAGIVVGSWIWRVVAHRISIPAGPVVAWGPTIVAPMVALVIAMTVAALTSRWVSRHGPAERLRTE